MRIHLTGSEEMQKALKKMSSLTPLEKVLTTTASDLQDKVEHRSPVDTGNLRRSIEINVDTSQMRAVVGTRVEYADHQEKGTRYMKAQPFFGPSVNEIAPKFATDLANAVVEGAA